MPKSNIQNVENTGEDAAPKSPKTKSARPTKAEILVKLLNSKRGATIEQLREARGWQARSVRG